MAGVFAMPALAMQPDLSQLIVPPGVLVAFAVFFLLGYLLFKHALCRHRSHHHHRTGRPAAPVRCRDSIACLVGLHAVYRDASARLPDSRLAIDGSFLAPVVMYARIVIQTPPCGRSLYRFSC